MALLASQAEQLVRLGANLEITSEAGYLASQVDQIVRVKSRNAAIKIHAANYLASQLEQFVRLGGGDVTIVI
jgi:hypothetical protein